MLRLNSVRFSVCGACKFRIELRTTPPYTERRTPSAVCTVVLLLIGGLNCLPAGLCWDLGLIYFFGCCLVNSCGGLIK